MQRAKYAVTFLSIALAVLSAFYWYRSTTTANDTAVLFFSRTKSLQVTLDGGSLYLYLETRDPPLSPNNWAIMSRADGDSRYRMDNRMWHPPRLGSLPGISFGRDQRKILNVNVWDAGLRVSLPLLAGLFLILPAVRGGRRLYRRLRVREAVSA
jgi:hypothetical protein